MGHQGVMMLTPLLSSLRTICVVQKLPQAGNHFPFIPLTLLSILSFFQWHTHMHSHVYIIWIDVCCHLGMHAYRHTHTKANREMIHTHTVANLQKEHISQEMQSSKANIAYLHCFHTQQNSHSNYLLWLTSRAYTNSSKRPCQHSQSQRTFQWFVRRIQPLDIIYPPRRDFYYVFLLFLFLLY